MVRIFSFQYTRPLFAIVALFDFVAAVFFIVALTMSWNNFYANNREYRMLLVGYIRKEHWSSRIRSYRDFGDFAELGPSVPH